MKLSTGIAQSIELRAQGGNFSFHVIVKMYKERALLGGERSRFGDHRAIPPCA
jgi:hypothetical protein